MDWNKKNLCKVGYYLHSKRTEKIKPSSYFRNKLDEIQKKSLDGEDQSKELKELESEINEHSYEPERDWINFLKENDCEQFNTSSEFWMIHNRMTPDNILVPMYKANDSVEFGAPGNLILCPKDFAEKILALESFGGE